MTKTPLGKLERISLCKAWAYEAGEFMPWLAQADDMGLVAQCADPRDSAGLTPSVAH